MSVEHAHGTTVVPAPPERVVTVGLNEQDAVLALGIVPVGVTDWYGDQPFATWPWAQEALGDAEPTVLVSADGLQFERIAALRPDLIIGTNDRLEEVREGRQVFTDGVTAGAIYFTSVLSLPYVLDKLVPAMASTLAGEGPAVIE